MQITVKIIDDKVRRSIRNVGEAIPHVGVRVLMRLFKNAIIRLQQYPPPPAGSRYVRTGLYGASFEAVKLGGAGVRLVNDANRHPWVGGDAYGGGQAWMHEGRWPLIAEIIDEGVTRQVVQEVNADLQTVIIQQGMGL